MEGETGLSQLTHVKIHASLRTSKLQCLRPSPVQCMPDEDVAGGQNDATCKKSSKTKNTYKHVRNGSAL